jgi:glucose dehydrogenase
VLFALLLLASPFCFFSAVADIFFADSSSNSVDVKQAYVHWANISAVVFLITLLAAIVLLVVNIRWHRKAGAARNPARIAILLAMVGLSTICAAAQKQTEPESDDWPFYGHDAGGMRYSPLAEINRENVSKLKVAWTFHTGDISDGSGGRPRSGFETTPILVDGTLYLTSGFNRVIALDPETGKQRWPFDPKVDQTWDFGDGLTKRGVAT